VTCGLELAIRAAMSRLGAALLEGLLAADHVLFRCRASVAKPAKSQTPGIAKRQRWVDD
jgi:hypothetical protein